MFTNFELANCITTLYKAFFEVYEDIRFSQKIKSSAEMWLEHGETSSNIYEPVYFGHYESVASPNGSKRFVCILENSSARDSTRSMKISKLCKNKSNSLKLKKRSKVNRQNLSTSLLSVNKFHAIPRKSSGRGSCYGKMIRKFGSFRSLSSFEHTNENLSDVKKRRQQIGTETDELQARQIKRAPIYTRKPLARSFIISAHPTLNTTDDDNHDELDTISEDLKSAYVTQTGLTQNCNQNLNPYSSSFENTLMEAFKENDNEKREAKEHTCAVDDNSYSKIKVKVPRVNK